MTIQFLFSVKRLLGLLLSLNRTPEWDEMSLMRWNAFGVFFRNGFRNDLDEGVIIHCRFQTDERTPVSITSGPRPGTSTQTEKLAAQSDANEKTCALAQKTHTKKTCSLLVTGCIFSRFSGHASSSKGQAFQGIAKQSPLPADLWEEGHTTAS